MRMRMMKPRRSQMVLLAALALAAAPGLRILASESTKETKQDVAEPAQQEEEATEPQVWILDPFQDLLEMRQQMDNVFSRSFNRYLSDPDFDPSWYNATLEPAFDLRERDNAYVVHLDLPGVDKSAVHVNVDNRVLRVSGKRDRTIEEKEGDKVIRRERSHGAFERVVSLPGPVKAEKVNAAYKDGVLTVTLPKAQPKKTDVTVEVK